MRLKNLMFKGVLGQSSPVRLAFDDNFCRPKLPSSLAGESVRRLLLPLLYPAECSDEDWAILERAEAPQAAAVFEVGGHTFRTLHNRSGAPIHLQVRKKGSFQTAATGAEEVSEAYSTRLQRPPIDEFLALNLWQFEEAARRIEEEVVDPEEIGPEAVEMLEEYEETLRLDEVESQIEQISTKIEKLRNRFGEGFEVEEELESAREQRSEIRAPDFSEEEFELLRNRDERIREYKQKLEELSAEEREKRQQVQELEPAPPWQNETMWLGVAGGVAALAISLVQPETFRWIALFDAAGFGVVAWTMLRYLTDLERVNIHKVRIESIKRRSAEVRREWAEFQERIDHLLVHEDAEEASELLERTRRVQELEARIEELEARAEQLADNQKFQKAKQRLRELKSERRELEAEREKLPEYGADLFQIENQLHALGIDPEAALRARRGEEGGTGDSPFEVLRSMADDLGFWKGGALEEKTLGLWQKMAVHVLSGDFDRVELAGDGTLELPGSSGVSDVEGWLEEHPDEGRVLAGTLALAIHLRGSSRDRQVETVLLDSPDAKYPAAIAQHLIQVLQGSAKRGHFVAFRVAG